MKRYLITLLIILMTKVMLYGQAADQLASKCAMSAGSDAKYLKDFRIQLGKAPYEGDLIFKAQMSLMKNIKYRFTMCNTDESKGQLFLTLKDDGSKQILSSLDQKTGKSYSSVDFICNKSGIYELYYDFTNRQQGSGFGVVSMIK
jgi:hypothetical protein